MRLDYVELFFVEWTENIKSTKEILNLIQQKEREDFSEVWKLLINVKAIRSQTEATNEQTKAINKNSESSDKLTKVWHFLTLSIVFLTLVQVWIAIFK